METTSGIFDANITSGENKSFWIATSQPIAFEKLQKDIETDVLIIGGGISGLTSAYCLQQADFKVVLIEDGFIGSGETGRTTAHLSYALDDGFYEIEKTFGNENARYAAESHMAAINFIENISMKEGINCDFKRTDGYLFLHENDEFKTLEDEFQATKRLALPTELIEHVPGLNNEGEQWCIRYPDQAHINPVKYLKGLADVFVRRGGRIFTETRAEEITRDGARANGYDIKAKHIVVATNTPVNDLVAMHTKQYAYRTYVIASKIPKGSVPDYLWWDTGDPESKWPSIPYHYVRVQEFDNENDLLISGGEDHKVGLAEDEKIPEEERYIRLINWTKRFFPAMGNVDYKWSGQIMEPVDMMGFIGRNPGDDNIYIITGDSGNGMTNGTIGGILITDLITGRENKWTSLYDPTRTMIKTAKEYIRNAGKMTAQYADWISAGDIRDAIDLDKDHGGIISSGLKKIAVYRDSDNNLHACSAVCSHLGGIVKWNGEEKSFDCPVHGSRFTPDGRVINGPALSDLKKVEIKSVLKEHHR